jgi:hypothetical protein
MLADEGFSQSLGGPLITVYVPELSLVKTRRLSGSNSLHDNK